MDWSQAHKSASQNYLNILGLFEGPDETKERERQYMEAKNRFPVDAKISDCYHLQATMKSVKDVVDAAYQSRTLDDSKGNVRVKNRTIDAYTKYLNEVTALYNSKQCEKAQADLESQQFFDTQYENLERVKGLGDAATNTTKYIVFGMLGVVVVVSGIIIFKKKNK